MNIIIVIGQKNGLKIEKLSLFIKKFTHFVNN